MAVLPEAFEVVELPGLGREDVDDETAEVHEHPRAAAMALAGEHRLAGFVHGLFDGEETMDEAGVLTWVELVAVQMRK